MLTAVVVIIFQCCGLHHHPWILFLSSILISKVCCFGQSCLIFFFFLSTSVNYLFVRFLSAGGIESLTFSSFPSFLTTQSCLIDSSKAGFIHFAINQDVETIFILLLIHWTRYCTTLQNARTIWILGKHKWLRNPCAWLGFCRKTRGSCSIVIWSCYLLNIITTFVNFICNSRHPTGSTVSTNLTECEKICTKLITIHYHWA